MRSTNLASLILFFLLKLLYIEKLKSKLGFEGAFYVDRVGRGGGLTFLWRKTGMFSLLSYSQSHIDMEVSEEDGLRWRVTGFYGFPDRSQ